jgi:centromere protein I
VLRKGPKRSKVSAIPDVHTYHTTETSVTLEGIDSVDDFVEKLDRIEPPGQLISFLTDPLLQKYLELRPSSITSTRIDLWLATCLEDIYEAERLGTGDSQYLDEVLDSLLKHAQYTKTLHPTVLAFLEIYLPLWGGQNHIDAVLGLLAYVPFEKFDNAYASLFFPAERALASQGMSACETMVGFYTGLLQRRVCALAPKNSNITTSDRQSLYDLTTHIATISSSLLLSMPPQSGQTLVSSILAFYETLSTSSKPHVVPIILPQMRLVYLLAQDASLTTLSRVCGVIGNYKLAFDKHPKPVKNYYPASVTDALNYCLRDIHNLIWVSRGLLTAEKALGVHCDPALRATLNDYLSSLDHEYAIGTALGLSNNAWLASLSAAAWRATEDSQIEKEGFDRNTIRYHQGPVSERSLEVLKTKGGVSVNWGGLQGYKVVVLNWLAERGLGGLWELMFATVKELNGKA